MIPFSQQIDEDRKNYEARRRADRAVRFSFSELLDIDRENRFWTEYFETHKFYNFSTDMDHYRLSWVVDVKCAIHHPDWATHVGEPPLLKPDKIQRYCQFCLQQFITFTGTYCSDVCYWKARHQRRTGRGPYGKTTVRQEDDGPQ